MPFLTTIAFEEALFIFSMIKYDSHSGLYLFFIVFSFAKDSFIILSLRLDSVIYLFIQTIILLLIHIIVSSYQYLQILDMIFVNHNLT
jgi:hypothetical protein